MVARAPPDEEMESMDKGDGKKPEKDGKPGTGMRMQTEQKGEHKH